MGPDPSLSQILMPQHIALRVLQRLRKGRNGPLNLLIDSTGIKSEGEGEWNARKHGGSNRRI